MKLSCNEYGLKLMHLVGPEALKQENIVSEGINAGYHDVFEAHLCDIVGEMASQEVERLFVEYKLSHFAHISLCDFDKYQLSYLFRVPRNSYWGEVYYGDDVIRDTKFHISRRYDRIYDLMRLLGDLKRQAIEDQREEDLILTNPDHRLRDRYFKGTTKKDREKKVKGRRKLLIKWFGDLVQEVKDAYKKILDEIQPYLEFDSIRHYAGDFEQIIDDLQKTLSYRGDETKYLGCFLRNPDFHTKID